MSCGYTVACIGAGYFSRFHTEAWGRIDGAQLVALADPDVDKARATGLRAYSDACDMLTRERPDIVDIVSPPPTHLEMIRAALGVRPLAIICQKPFCQSLEDARAAAELARAADVPLIVHENFRFQPWYRAIKAQIAAGAVGDVLQLTFRLRPGDGQGAGAYLDRQPYFQTMRRFLVHETAVHWIDTFRYLMGAPDAVFADLRRMNPAIAGEDAGYILFAYPGGRRALFDANRLLDHPAVNTRCTMGEALVEGTRGTLLLGGDGAVHLRGFGQIGTQEILAASAVAGFGGDCVYRLQEHVVAALRGGAAFENLAADYLPVLAQEAAIYASAAAGRWMDVKSPPS